ncbi:sensor histidine kinase [Nocardioides speluncae]|uniref:sensor histidine kinase n=1 Tax=Nocardioides speluncae TaxID=2670337 RepID=UPI001F0C6FA4|nr:sensor histidine kinase [Nocardioides speluncae]
MIPDIVRSLLAEPRAPGAPRRVWRDWLLVAVLVPAAVLEGVLGDHVVWPAVSIIVALGLAYALLWRRTHPLQVVLAVFGTHFVTFVAAAIAGVGAVGVYASILTLLLPYALLRWGSGREVAIGVPVILVAGVVGTAEDYNGLGEAVAGLIFLFIPAVLGAAVRFAVTSRSRELDQVKLLERQQLARELHDTVAHHVSAIAIRAQAGQVVAASRPEAAAEALAVIEDEASRTLAEMRLVVGSLRDEASAELAPQPGLVELRGLARADGRPAVYVDVSGELGTLGAAVGTALFRIAQESVTNAVRHARQATRVDVAVTESGDEVLLTVRDDGVDAAASYLTGYGLIGMTERAALLGGTLDAGPDPAGGWTVRAVLPKSGRDR